MLEAARAEVPSARAAIFAAAVLDFAPAEVADAKLPSDRPHEVRLEPTPKIIRAVDEVAPPGLVKIGFKLEYRPGGTDEAWLVAAGERALLEQRGDAVLVNAIDHLGDGTAHPALLLGAGGGRRSLEGKAAIARALAEHLERRLAAAPAAPGRGPDGRDRGVQGTSLPGSNVV
jgi:hypothetical protein